MALPYRPLSRPQRVWLAIAMALAVHAVILPFAAKDAVFHFAPKPRPATVSLVPWTPSAANAQHNSQQSSPLANAQSKPKTAEEKKKEEEEAAKKVKIDGQIVSLGPPQDERAPIDPTKYLSEYDSRVLKETRAKETSAFFKNALSRVQKEGKQEHVDQKSQPAPVPETPPQGDSSVAGKEGGGIAERAPTATPMRARQDRVSLERAPDGTVRTRAASDAMKGDARKLAMVAPTPKHPAASEGRGEGAPGGTQGAPTGTQPLKLSLDHPLESLGPIAGGPMSDALQGVQEGDETLLNSRGFVYASYLNRIKESVARIWTSDVDDAQRRHDPTGQTYLYKDRRTDVDYTLGKDGQILAVKVRTSSGVDFLDEVAVAAFKKLDRVPNPPPGLLGEQGTVTLGFSFLMMTGQGGPLIRMGPAYLPPPTGRY